MAETEIKKEVEKVEVAEALDTKGDPSAPAKSGTPSEPTHLKNDAEDLGPAVVKPTDKNPDSTKKVKKHSDQVTANAKDGSLPKDNKPSAAAEEAEVKDGVETVAETATDDIDLTDDVKALVSTDADLSDEFKDKAATIFEAAVSAKVISEVNERLQVFEDEYTKELSEAKDEYMTNMSEKIDGYLNYVVEEWMKENELAVEKGIRSELVEDFMTGLKNLFQEHYIDIPEEKVDLVDDLFEKVEELESKLDESINTNVEVKKELAKFKKEEVLRNVSEELAETEKEKLTKLADGIDYEDDTQYQEKLEVLKENYFPKATEAPQTISEEVENTETEEVEETIDPSISRYVNAMKRHN